MLLTLLHERHVAGSTEPYDFDPVTEYRGLFP